MIIRPLRFTTEIMHTWTTVRGTIIYYSPGRNSGISDFIGETIFKERERITASRHNL
jgi:hypothetical protein